MRTSVPPTARFAALGAGVVVLFAACSTPAAQTASGAAVGTSASGTKVSASTPTDVTSSAPVTENASAATGSGSVTSGRVTVSYEGGILVLDAATLDPVADLPSDKFTRLNPAGDGRHVMVTTSKGFQVLDTAAGSSDTPQLTDVVFRATTPGHVVRHSGKTVLFDDGTGDTTIFDTADLGASADAPKVTTMKGIQAHHGVSVMLEDGTFITTVGNEDARSGISVRNAAGTEIAGSAECPGIHGEGTAQNEAVVFGCENGALLYRDGRVVKLSAPDAPYGRMGNAYVSETSPLVVGDYTDDQDAEGYLRTAVALVDTVAKSFDVVDLPQGVEYTFRGVARGPGELAYILATDGKIHVMDPATGTITRSFPVIKAWEGPAEWQDAHPAIVVKGSIAYVSEPAARSVHAVDLATGATTATGTFDVLPNELAVVG